MAGYADFIKRIQNKYSAISGNATPTRNAVPPIGMRTGIGQQNNNVPATFNPLINNAPQTR